MVLHHKMLAQMVEMAAGREIWQHFSEHMMKCLPRQCLLEHLKGILFVLANANLSAPTSGLDTAHIHLVLLAWKLYIDQCLPNTVRLFLPRTANTIGHYMQVR